MKSLRIDVIYKTITDIIDKIEEIKNPSPFRFIFFLILSSDNIEQYPKDNADNPTPNIIIAINTVKESCKFDKTYVNTLFNKKDPYSVDKIKFNNNAPINTYLTVKKFSSKSCFLTESV